VNKEINYKIKISFKMADLKAFAEQLVNLTVKEVNELAILKDEYGIEPAAAAPVMVAAGGGGAEAEAVEEKLSST
jgi:large subunit ribosomal protein L7/L12